MATPNEQLINIYNDLKSKFDNSPYIRVTPKDDDPPEKYEIEYNIQGLAQDDKGNVVEAQSHRIFINIPFGFPHFPPSCVPQTPTFHPDFDQAAICIGEFWNKDRSLAELIIHIGRMINGEIFSTENAFNDAAVSWYKKIRERLPLASIDFDAQKTTEEFVSPESALELDEDDLFSDDIDTLDDDDIAGSSDYFSTPTGEEEEEGDISFPSKAQSTGKSSVNRVYLLIRQKRFFELSGYLQDLPQDLDLDDREDIEKKVANLLAKARKLEKEADELEHQGDPRAAMELFEKVAEIVPDYPNIEENIDRTKNSVELVSSDWESEPESTETEQEQEKPSPSPKKRVAFFEETTKATFKLLPILGGGLVVVLAVIFIAPLFSASSKLEEAEQFYNQCKNYLDQNQFNRARGQCQLGLNKLKDISLYKKSEKNALQQQINMLLNSKKMEQGLAGRVLFDGKYVNKADMEKVQDFKKLKREADDHFTNSRWKKALGVYNEALKKTKGIADSIKDITIQEVRDRHGVAEINLAIDRAESLLARNELELGEEQYDAALQKARELPEELGGRLIERISPKLQEIKYLQHLNLGKKYFDANDWESAIEQYKKALQLRGSDIIDGQDGEKSLYGNMAEAELFSLINSAKDAFSQSQWTKAISYYREAMQLVKDKKDLLQRINPDGIQQQLERIVLRARIVQNKQKADSLLEDNEYKEAIASLQKVIEAVTASGFENDKEFKAIIAGTRETIADTREKAAIAKRRVFLENNYIELFTENYSAAVPKNLSDPKAEFVKYIDDNRELYKLQCLERNRGRKLRLVMFYSYDPARDAWEFYSVNQ